MKIVLVLQSCRDIKNTYWILFEFFRNYIINLILIKNIVNLINLFVQFFRDAYSSGIQYKFFFKQSFRDATPLNSWGIHWKTIWVFQQPFRDAHLWIHQKFIGKQFEFLSNPSRMHSFFNIVFWELYYRCDQSFMQSFNDAWMFN